MARKSRKSIQSAVADVQIATRQFSAALCKIVERGEI